MLVSMSLICTSVSMVCAGHARQVGRSVLEEDLGQGNRSKRREFLQRLRILHGDIRVGRDRVIGGAQLLGSGECRRTVGHDPVERRPRPIPAPSLRQGRAGRNDGAQIIQRANPEIEGFRDLLR